MNTRKIVFSLLPVILIILIALGGLLYFVINGSNGPAEAVVPAQEQVIQQEEQTPPAIITPEGITQEQQPEAADAPAQEDAPQDGKPRVIYENQEE